jgi:lycopene cyclase domain-containing protein
MVAIDRRFRVFFWKDARAATAVMVTGLLFFACWDLLGIHFGVFFRGQSTPMMTGILIAPQLPLEEPFFLAFLCYLTMNLIGLAGRTAAARRARLRRPR